MVASSRFNLAEISKGSPINIANTLLYLASSLQQLDPEFDSTQLKLYPSVESRMERYVCAVQALVTSDDELISSMDGIKCLVLQATYHSNAGNPRRAWLNIRKAMNIGQLMGLHLPSCTIRGGRDMWTKVVQGDRYFVSPYVLALQLYFLINELGTVTWTPCWITGYWLQSRRNVSES